MTNNKDKKLELDLFSKKKKKVKATAKNNEAVVQKEILKWLNNQANTMAFKSMSANINGVSDIIVCMGGKYIAIEVKAGYRQPKGSPNQIRFIQTVLLSGGIGFVANSLKMVKKTLNAIFKEELSENQTDTPTKQLTIEKVPNIDIGDNHVKEEN